MRRRRWDDGGTVSRADLEKTTAAQPEQLLLSAWRLFRLSNDETLEPVLYGSYDKPWYGAVIQAECELEASNDSFFTPTERCEVHLAYGGCVCGIYSLIGPVRTALDPGTVLAECVVWGWVIPHTEGYRSQFCEITSLCVCLSENQVDAPYVAVWKRKLEDRYKVPVAITQPKHELIYISGIAMCSVCRNSMSPICPQAPAIRSRFA